MFHSCETSLLKLHNDLIANRDNNLSTVSVLLDLSAAFDTVDHHILIRRLDEFYGIKQTTLAWFQSYLSDRTSSVYIKNTYSQPINLSCGVP